VTRRRLLGAGVLLIVALGLAGLFVRVLLTASESAAACLPVPPTHGRIAPIVYAVAGAGAFVVGGLLGTWRSGQVLAGERTVHRSDRVIDLALIVLLATVAVALGYETYALVTPGLWPITFYVRCANVIDPASTLLGLIATAALLGHWLWRPWRAGAAAGAP
jgi:hypothetical protein